jgi:hypothetical protein
VCVCVCVCVCVGVYLLVVEGGGAESHMKYDIECHGLGCQNEIESCELKI